MTEQKIKMPEAENPETFQSLKLTKPKKVAAGLPAVFVSMQHVLKAMNAGRGLKALLAVNQKDGYDCPGCAWPDPDDDRSVIAEYCENGAKAVAEEATTKKLTEDFFKKNSVYALSQHTDYEIGGFGRIAQPMYLPEGAAYYEPISWENAFKKIGDHLNKLASPDEAIFYTSGKVSNEAAFLYQLFVREYGTNNLPDCSNMCHESSGVALQESLGIGKGSVTLEDFYNTELIIILGQNPGTNHPRMLSALQKAKKNGAKIISINPLFEAGLIAFNNPQTANGLLDLETKLTDLYIQVKINGDMALLRAIETILYEEEQKAPGSIFDHEFIAKQTVGYEELTDVFKTNDVTELSEMCGVPLDMIREAANLIKDKKKIIACWAMGLTQHKNSVDSIKEIVNLLLLKGSIGKSGAGTCPVRGHSNVQGDRTVGIWERPTKEFLDKLEQVYGFEPPRAHGHDTVDAIHAMHEGKAKVFIGLGGNYLSATPDTTYTADALRKCDLTVHVSTKLNRSHLVHGKEAIILPCLGRSDKDMQGGQHQFVTCENSMGVVQMSRGNLKPVSDQLLSESAIVCGMAKATLNGRTKVNWDLYMEHYDYIRNDIELVVPGFENYNQRVRDPGGFYLPNSARSGTFKTDIEKAKFSWAEVTPIKLAEHELLMMTIRTHDQFNTTIYGLHDRYRGIHNERRVVLMNEQDISRLGMKPGDVVDLFNYHDEVERVAHKFIVISYNIPKQCVATYFPETNVLVPVKSTAERSNTPTSKSVIIEIRKHIEG